MSTYYRHRDSFERQAHWAGQFPIFIIAFALAQGAIIGWIFSGSYFPHSDKWQLVINTGTTIVTFLMALLIQHTHNKDCVALPLKLNELIVPLKSLSNWLPDVEDVSEKELDTPGTYYSKLVRMANLARGLSVSHCIEESKEFPLMER